MNKHLIGMVFKIKYNGLYGVVKSVHGSFINLEVLNPNGKNYDWLALMDNLTTDI